MGFRGQITYLSQLIADSITGAIINGGTITGALFRTAASGHRWEISSGQPSANFPATNAINGFSGLAQEQYCGSLTVDGSSNVYVNGVQQLQTSVNLTTPALTGTDQAKSTAWPQVQMNQTKDTQTGALTGSIHLDADSVSLGTSDASNNPVSFVVDGTNGPQWKGRSVALLAYPVGSIYMSVANTNPGSLFGGTWAAWGTGRVPVAVDTTQTEFNTVEKTGGEKTHQLTAAESGLPSEGGGLVFQQNSGGYYFNVGSDSDATHRANLVAGGASAAQAHNNLQPYITCYMWKRTA